MQPEVGAPYLLTEAEKNLRQLPEVCIQLPALAG